MLSQKKVVVPFDFSPDATAAVRKVLEWSDPSTEVFLITVLKSIDTIPTQPGTMMTLVDDSERIEAARADVRTRFPNPQIVVEVCTGDPPTEIVEYAQAVSADLVVMPTHGRSGIRRIAIGSVAERVVRQSGCSVIVLRGAHLAKAS